MFSRFGGNRLKQPLADPWDSLVFLRLVLTFYIIPTVGCRLKLIHGQGAVLRGIDRLT